MKIHHLALPSLPYLNKNTLHSPFLEVTVAFFLGESSIVALYSNLFEKLGKSEMKN
jgi:hypothetical protein